MSIYWYIEPGSHKIYCKELKNDDDDISRSEVGNFYNSKLEAEKSLQIGKKWMKIIKDMAQDNEGKDINESSNTNDEAVGSSTDRG